ncbi:hypothetical protein L195_g009722, partial [Trifolium pratense]
YAIHYYLPPPSFRKEAFADQLLRQNWSLAEGNSVAGEIGLGL